MKIIAEIELEIDADSNELTDYVYLVQDSEEWGIMQGSKSRKDR